MIYVNAAAGQKVTISKPIKIAIPSDYADKKMQLYKGEKKSATTINWTNPAPLKENPQLSNIEKGAILFQQKCTSCHGIGKEGSGPDLANYTKRHIPHESDGDGMYRKYDHRFSKVYYPYTVENAETDSAKNKYLYNEAWSDPYICNLITLFNNKEVDLSDDFNKNTQDWLNVYSYIQNESAKRKFPNPRQEYLSKAADSCELYKKLKEELEQKREKVSLKRRQLISDNDPLVDRKPDPTWRENNSIPPPGFTDKVQPNNFQAVYYQFTIESFGWFNIDMMAKDIDGVKESELFARITGSYREKIKIYLIIPSAKVYVEGGPSGRAADEYAFYKKDGSIPLPQNTKAYILAITEANASVAYSLKAFTTQEKQQLDISLTTATKEAFATEIKNLDAGSLSISVKDTKNAAAIRETDKTIQQLEAELKNADLIKPKNCDCNCGAKTDTLMKAK
jgi:hypothetical protein